METVCEFPVGRFEKKGERRIMEGEVPGRCIGAPGSGQAKTKARWAVLDLIDKEDVR